MPELKVGDVTVAEISPDVAQRLLDEATKFGPGKSYPIRRPTIYPEGLRPREEWGKPVTLELVFPTKTT